MGNPFEAIKEMLGGLDNAPTIFDHYGVKEEDAKKIVKKMLSDMILNDLKSDVLDKWFPRLTAEERVNVFCYSEAAKVARIAQKEL